MDPQVLGVISGAMVIGLAAGKVIDNIWSYYGSGSGNGKKNSKAEMYLEQLVKLAEVDRDKSIEQAEILRTTFRELEAHDKRTSKACDEIFRLLRREKD